MQSVIRKFFRNLLLRGLILAFTGDQTAVVFQEPEEEEAVRSAAITAMQALDTQVGLQGMLLPIAAYQVVSGDGL